MVETRHRATRAIIAYDDVDSVGFGCLRYCCCRYLLVVVAVGSNEDLLLLRCLPGSRWKCCFTTLFSRHLLIVLHVACSERRFRAKASSGIGILWWEFFINWNYSFVIFEKLQLLTSIYCPTRYKTTDDQFKDFFDTLGDRFLAAGDYVKHM